MNDFDKELERIYISTGRHERIMPLDFDNAIKLAVEKYVIGADETPTTQSQVIPYKIRKDQRREQRQSLWGDKR